MKMRILALILFSATLVACTCGETSLEDAFAGADFVFAATVVGRVQPRGLGGKVGWRMIQSRVWKGRGTDTVTVYTDQYQATCGYPFKMGERYLVFAWAQGTPGDGVVGWPLGVTFPAAMTGLCSKTQRLKDAKHIIKKLGEPISESP